MTTAELVYQHVQKLPESVAAEVLDFVRFLEQKQAGTDNRQTRPPPQPGSAKGRIWIAEGFDAPLADFEDYQ